MRAGRTVVRFPQRARARSSEARTNLDAILVPQATHSRQSRRADVELRQRQRVGAVVDEDNLGSRFRQVGELDREVAPPRRTTTTRLVREGVELGRAVHASAATEGSVEVK